MRRALRGIVALAAAAFAYGAYVYLTLPDVRPLARENPPTTAFIQLRQREALEAGRELRIRQQWVPYSRISPHLKRAVLVTEDAAFWDHEGLDYNEIRASIQVNLAEGRFVRGASTITQQLAKNLYLSPSRNPVRKLREVVIARRLEAELTKARIFEIYLNVIEWGDGIFGAEAASRAYFGKPATDLTPEEAALLAGAIINPRVHNPARPTRRLLARQQIILRRMGGVTPPVAVAAAGPAPGGDPAPTPAAAPDEPDEPEVSGESEDAPPTAPANPPSPARPEAAPVPAGPSMPGGVLPPPAAGTSTPPAPRPPPHRSWADPARVPPPACCPMALASGTRRS